MSLILTENWNLLSREHERFMQDPEYLAYLTWLNQQPPLTPEEEKQWDIIVQKDQAGHSPLLVALLAYFKH
jgi:hypothetical protein